MKKRRQRTIALTPIVSSPAEPRTTLNAACDRFGKIMKDFGIKAE